MSFYKETSKGVELFVKAAPAASKSEIVGVVENALKIRIAAPAVDGKANEELIKFLAKRFKIAKSDIRIVSGESAKIKRLLLPSEIIEKIKEIQDGKN
jgi:hypothetical protein